MFKLSYKGFLNAVAGQVGADNVYTASHNLNGYLVVSTLTSGSVGVSIPQYAKILSGTNYVATGLVITLPKLTATPNHAITAASSSTITSNAITLSFTCTGYMNWINTTSVTISGVTPIAYNGTYTTISVTGNTGFSVSKAFTGTNGDPGLAAATTFGTATMAITDIITGLYRTNLTSTIASQTNLTFTIPNVIPANTQAISIFSGSALLADVMFFNRVSNQLESIALPTQTPYRLDYFQPGGVGVALYASTAVSGTSFIKSIFWGVS